MLIPARLTRYRRSSTCTGTGTSTGTSAGTSASTTTSTSRRGGMEFMNSDELCRTYKRKATTLGAHSHALSHPLILWVFLYIQGFPI